MISDTSYPISNWDLMSHILFSVIVNASTPALPLLVLGVYPPPAVSMSPPC
jgi:hypothetical protein